MLSKRYCVNPKRFGKVWTRTIVSVMKARRTNPKYSVLTTEELAPSAAFKKLTIPPCRHRLRNLALNAGIDIRRGVCNTQQPDRT
jgi:hypothetical protein